MTPRRKRVKWNKWVARKHRLIQRCTMPATCFVSLPVTEDYVEFLKRYLDTEIQRLKDFNEDVKCTD